MEPHKDMSGSFHEVRIVDSLPPAREQDDWRIEQGFVVRMGGPYCLPSLFFFNAKEPALVFGRAARMSQNVSSYGVRRGALERKYKDGGDERTLYVTGDRLDRSADADEQETFLRFAAGTVPDSSHWHG